MTIHTLTQEEIDNCVAIVISGAPIEESHRLLDEFRPLFGDRQIVIINNPGGDFKTLDRATLLRLLEDAA
ncbi:MAG: hypothetical protein E6Q97_02980 [Desulfurellales bacterium]|nr:MAG: hypothetical protein E6Q97_02980 [Desulfurellales bacterium]